MGVATEAPYPTNASAQTPAAPRFVTWDLYLEDRKETRAMLTELNAHYKDAHARAVEDREALKREIHGLRADLTTLTKHDVEEAAAGVRKTNRIMAVFTATLAALLASVVPLLTLLLAT